MHAVRVARPFALTGVKADERATLLGMLDAHPTLVATHPGQTLIGDKNYFGKGFEAELAEPGREFAPPHPQGRERLAGVLPRWGA